MESPLNRGDGHEERIALNRLHVSTPVVCLYALPWIAAQRGTDTERYGRVDVSVTPDNIH